MKTKAVFKMMAFLLLFIAVCGCQKSDKSSPDNIDKESPIAKSNEKYITGCITGKIVEIKIDKEHIDGYRPNVLKDIKNNVFIGWLEFSEEDEKQFGFIETILVPKNQFPVQDYQFGDTISFRIVEVKSTYPNPYFGVDECTAYICDIELCK